MERKIKLKRSLRHRLRRRGGGRGSFLTTTSRRRSTTRPTSWKRVDALEDPASSMGGRSGRGMYARLRSRGALRGSLDNFDPDCPWW